MVGDCGILKSPLTPNMVGSPVTAGSEDSLKSFGQKMYGRDGPSAVLNVQHNTFGKSFRNVQEKVLKVQYSHKSALLSPVAGCVFSCQKPATCPSTCLRTAPRVQHVHVCGPHTQLRHLSSGGGPHVEYLHERVSRVPGTCRPAHLDVGQHAHRRIC